MHTFSTTKLVECMREYAMSGYECYKIEELQSLLLGHHNVQIPLHLLVQMVDTLITKGYAQRTVHGNVQLFE